MGISNRGEMLCTRSEWDTIFRTDFTEVLDLYSCYAGQLLHKGPHTEAGGQVGLCAQVCAVALLPLRRAGMLWAGSVITC